MGLGKNKKRTPTSEVTIGRLARMAGVSVETIRYYERFGLLTRPPRAGRGYRRYPMETLEHVGFIKQVQSLGFSLGEIAELISLDKKSKADGKAIAVPLLAEVQRRLRDLKAIENVLRYRAHSGRVSKATTPSIVVTLSKSTRKKNGSSRTRVGKNRA
jgi:MerR family mercuric resistance operon transcriptional regulator